MAAVMTIMFLLTLWHLTNTLWHFSNVIDLIFSQHDKNSELKSDCVLLGGIESVFEFYRSLLQSLFHVDIPKLSMIAALYYKYYHYYTLGCIKNIFSETFNL